MKRSMWRVKGVGCCIGVILLLCTAHLCTAGQEKTIDTGVPLVIRFDTGKSLIGKDDRARIGRYLGDYGLTDRDKILVIGHTDNSGASGENIRLSHKRAQAVRKALIKRLKMDGRHVIAVGKGEEIPVGDNKTRVGRAMNRRVEIYLAQVVSQRLEGGTKRVAPNVDAVDALVRQAKERLRRQDVPGALRALDDARAQGGNELASWHAAYAIVGFYSGVRTDAVKAHLRRALTMDPFNEDAREFMGRVKAQEDVTAGIVTMDMGRDEKAPIAVRFDSQAREYLRQFDMQLLSRRPGKRQSIEIWRCSDPRGEIVNYYFDRSGVYGWAYSSNMKRAG